MTTVKFHTNVFDCDNCDDWLKYTETLMNSNNGVHNNECAIDSDCCSKEMSKDVTDLCAWHRMRMARHVQITCGCKKLDLCSGDAVARGMFRKYYDCWDMPVIDSIGAVYCCGKCENTSSNTHTCGEMFVGPCCLHKHSGLIERNDED
jgi:hypothetical protein